MDDASSGGPGGPRAQEKNLPDRVKITIVGYMGGKKVADLYTSRMSVLTKDAVFFPFFGDVKVHTGKADEPSIKRLVSTANKVLGKRTYNGRTVATRCVIGSEMGIMLTN